MSYRTAGLIDAAADAHRPRRARLRPRRSSKAIEEYTIEASIIKVFGTETLDFVADEALQMLGGYGFIEEYPVERHYRDSRINRIFEGTNEINRLHHPGDADEAGRRRAASRICSSCRRSQDEIAEAATAPACTVGPARPEVAGRARWRSGSSPTRCRSSCSASLADLQEKQQHLERFADMIIDVYAMESAVVRTQKSIRRRGEDKAKLEQDIVTVFVADATERLAANARTLFANDTDGPELETHLATIARFTSFVPKGALDARVRIAEQIVAAGGTLA